MARPDRPACHVCGAPAVSEIGFPDDPDGRQGTPEALRGRRRPVCASPLCDADLQIRAFHAARHHGAHLVRPCRSTLTPKEDSR